MVTIVDCALGRRHVRDAAAYVPAQIAGGCLGTTDADHPRKLDEGIVTWLNERGAKADFIYLGDRGITGNGHMMMLENNSTALAHQIMAWIEGV